MKLSPIFDIVSCLPFISAVYRFTRNFATGLLLTYSSILLHRGSHSNQCNSLHCAVHDGFLQWNDPVSVANGIFVTEKERDYIYYIY